VSGNSWTLIGIAVLGLLLMVGAAIVEASAGLISRQHLRQVGSGRERSVQALIDPRRSFVSSLQLVQGIGMAMASALLAIVFAREGWPAETVAPILIVIAIFLFFGQALPRALARTNPSAAAGLLLRAVQFLNYLVRPLMALADGAANAFTRLLGGDRPDQVPIGAEDEFLLRAHEAADDGVIEPEERAMIDNVLHLEDTHAHDIMVPRMDIVAVEENATPREVIDKITSHGHSRIPVYRESIDTIVGILYAKDLLPFVIRSSRNLPLQTLVRPAYVVPESKPIDDLLTELRRDRVHIAIVADEYGGTAGLVTIEDILEEIVGEIEDEYDTESTLIEVVSEGEIIVDGRVSIEDIERIMGLRIGDDENPFGTVAGFVHWHLDRLPRPGDTFSAYGLHGEILAVEGHRLRRLRLTRVVDRESPLQRGLFEDQIDGTALAP
jgi:CBS domain containing-hemolysin-like protein